MCFCFLVGILFAIYEKSIVRYFSKYPIKWFFALGLPTTAFLFLYYILYDNILIGAVISRNIGTVLFVSTITIVLMKGKISNKLVGFIGKISFELYLLHKIPILLLRSNIIYINNDSVYSFFCFTLAVGAAFFVNKLDVWTVTKAKKFTGRFYTNKTEFKA